MNGTISPRELSALSSTLLIPLWAKAEEYGRADALLRDAEAVRMRNAINYDFSRFAKAKISQTGCCGRAKIIDEMAQRFLNTHPDAVVVQIGAGLDARYERMGRPQITAWYDLDLPEVMEVRRRLLPESGNVYLGASMFDEAWADTAAAHGKPVLLIIEGVLMYFEEAQVKAFFDMVRRKLPHAQIITDTMGKLGVGHAARHDAVGRIDEKPPEFRWGINDADDVLQLIPGSSLIETEHLSRICRSRYPLVLRLIYATRWGRRKMDMQIMRIQL